MSCIECYCKVRESVVKFIIIIVLYLCLYDAYTNPSSSLPLIPGDRV